MRITKYIFLLFILFVACDPSYNNNAPTDGVMTEYDSVYTLADIQWHKQYYPMLERQVFSIDLLSEGLSFDSTNHIVGTGYNLYISDIFLPLATTCLQSGIYQMDSTASSYTFLPYMYFEGNITGCYLLDIQESNIQQIIGFTTGTMQLEYIGENDIRLDLLLYTADSIRYHAMYEGPTQ